MPKALIYIVLFFFFSKSISAQSFRNDWIDYTKTYYKFKVGSFGNDAAGPIKNGVIRIPQSTLALAGLGSIPAENFQLWSSGKEVPIYISKSTGILNPSDYIEFWGQMANGEIDSELFRDTNSQLSNYWCISTDSSSYFLTVNSEGNNFRLVNTINDVQNATIPAEKNFAYSTGLYYRNILNPGFGILFSGLPLYLSSYEAGEGFTSRVISPNSCSCSNAQLQAVFAKLHADTTATTCSIKVNMSGNAANNRNVKISLNKDSVFSVTMGFYNYSKTIVTNLAGNRIKNDSANIIIENKSEISQDQMLVANVEFSYARKFNFSGSNVFAFNIDASTNGRLLKISNFNSGLSTPVLLDLTNGKRYVAINTLGSDTLQFLLEPSVQNYSLVLLRSDGSTAKTIANLEKRNFTNYRKTSNQGNYLIISNPLIYGSDTSNYVEQFRAYRSTAAGGNYNAKLISISELEDQFSYGLNRHPLAIINFLRYAKKNFTDPPAYLFIIGKGVSYLGYRNNGENALTDKLNLVQTFGYPGSDNLLTAEAGSDFPSIPVGRLSAVSPQEVGIYLNKVKEYEAAQNNNSDSIEIKSWMKKVLHITGSDDAVLGNAIDTLMKNYTKVIEDTLYGGNVISFSKSADPAGYENAVINFKDIYNAGSGLVTYFGHSSSRVLDFSLDEPSNYSNNGKYPLFIVNGCLAGNIFGYDGQRLNNISTIAEKYMLAPRSGSIAYLATSSFGIVNYLDVFTRKFYNNISFQNYANGLGDITKQGIYDGLTTTGFSDFFGRMHAHQYVLNGDPALRMNSFSLPDYAIENSTIEIPSFISAADDSFPLKIKVYNLGKASSDSLQITLYRLLNNKDSVIVYTQKLAAINSFDSLFLKLPIIPNRDTGVIHYSVIIDSRNKITELSEKNNRALFTTNISSNEIRPVFPYNYAIVNQSKIKIIATTAYALQPTEKYWLEIDTSALFTSSGKVRLAKIAKGGIIEFPNIKLPLNNITYYWRTAKAAIDPLWQSFSFTYQQDSSLGYQQSHFYQHTQSTSVSISDDTTSRQWKFGSYKANLFLKQSVYPTSGTEDYDFTVAVNGTTLGVSACVGSSIIFHVFDPNTMKIITNTSNPYGAAPPCGDLRANNFEFSTQTPASRKNAMDFLDNFVPKGYYVAIRKIYDLGNADWAPTVWAKDTSIYGRNNSLYHRLKDQGLLIDSFIYPRTFIMVYKKNDSANFKPVSVFSKGIYDQITYSSNILTVNSKGIVLSPVFGPVNKWDKVSWKGGDNNANNKASMEVVAYDQSGQDSVFYTLQKNKSQDISNIDVLKYPNIRLQMSTVDSVSVMPFQLQEWKLNMSPAPEGAIAPNLGMNIPSRLIFNHDVNQQFDTLSGFVVFKNISNISFKPLAVKIRIVDSTGKEYLFPSQPLTRALNGGDTIKIRFVLNVKKLTTGKYNFILEVNPENAQPEQYHFNNTLFKDLIIVRRIPTSSFLVIKNGTRNSLVSTSVSPNPFLNKLLVKTAESEKCMVKLMSINGTLLIQKTFYNSIELNTSFLSSGTYIATVLCGNRKETFKIEK